MDPTREPTLPFLFFGQIEPWGEEDRVCDFYLGPGGDHIYHVHRPYEDDPVLVGGPPLRPDQRDPGTVVFGLMASNPALHPIIGRSIKHAFKDATFHQMLPSEQGGFILHPDTDASGLLSHLPLHSDPKRNLRACLDADCGDRFLAKLALGIGTALLGDAFVDSGGASRLRQALWTQRTEDWPDGVRGTPFFQEIDPKFKELLNWNDCHFLMISRTGDGIGLGFCAYGRHPAFIMMDEENHYDVGNVDGALVYIIAPGIRRYAGPMALMDYVDARLGNTNGALAELQGYLDSAIELPPAHVPSRSADRPQHPQR